MNMENVVLVRAMSHLPLDGVLKVSCEGMYLKTTNYNDFYHEIKKYVRKDIESKIGRELNTWNNEEDINLLDQEMEKYCTFTSSYTSTLSFSLNGLVPDDINNKFSEMKIAVLDPIRNHTNENYINIDSIDTTIKGSINTSSEAILVIDREYYLSLSEDIKTNLESNYRIELFDGSLKDAVSNTLKKYNFPDISYKQKHEVDDEEILDSEKREELISFQDSFAKEVSASRLKLEFLYLSPLNTLTGVDKLSAEKIKGDFNKSLDIEKYYKHKFYDFLVNELEKNGIILNSEDIYYLYSNYSNSEEILENVVRDLVNCYGLDGVKNLVQVFNQSIIDNYLTNEEIINLNSESRKY